MMTEEERKKSKKAARRRWRAKNREKVRAYERARYRKNSVIRKRIKKQAAKWAKDHSEAHRESARRSYHKRALDPEKRAIMNARSKKYHDENIEKTRAYHREYYRKNKEAEKVRRARVRTPGKVAAAAVLAKALREGRLVRAAECQRCHKPAKTEAHHCNGYAEGNGADIEWLCKSCHMKQTWADKKRRLSEQHI